MNMISNQLLNRLILKRLAVAGMAAVVAIGISACNQSYDGGYKKGYEDGFKAGAIAAEKRQQDTPRMKDEEALKFVLTNIRGRPLNEQAGLYGQIGSTTNFVREARYTGSGVWIIKLGDATFTLDERTMQVKP